GRVGVSVGATVLVAVAVAVPVGTPVAVGVTVAGPVPAGSAKQEPLLHELDPVQSLKSSQLAPSVAGAQAPLALSQAQQSPHSPGPKFWHWPVFTLQKSIVHLLPSESGHSRNSPIHTVPRQTSPVVQGPNESVHDSNCFSGSGEQKPCAEQVPSQPV